MLCWRILRLLRALLQSCRATHPSPGWSEKEGAHLARTTKNIDIEQVVIIISATRVPPSRRTRGSEDEDEMRSAVQPNTGPDFPNAFSADVSVVACLASIRIRSEIGECLTEHADRDSEARRVF